MEKKSMKRTVIIATAVALIAMQGCAGMKNHYRAEQLARDPRAIAFFMELDSVTHQFEAVDGSNYRVPDFPYLRTNRFLEELKSNLNGPEQEYLWIKWMQQLDLKSREKEIANLPDAALVELGDRTGETVERETLYERVIVYSDLLLTKDWRHPEFISAVKEAVFVPDEYSTTMRIFGLYPLVAIPVSIATYSARTRYVRWHQTPLYDFETHGQLMTFVPPKTARSFSHAEVERLFDPKNHDAFGLPQLATDDILKIAHLFAPVFTQDVLADYDRFGRVKWESHTVTIEPQLPTIYYYVSSVFVDSVPAIQINYTLWYSDRMGDNSPRIERGPLDGLTIRITIDRYGRVVMADAMNNCGCYYFFIPRKAYIKEIIEKPNDFEPLIPAWLPDNFPAERIHLRINSGWHQIQHIQTGGIPAETISYEFLPYDALESLPRENGLRESVFTSEGIMKNSSRIEPYIFFSMGIPNIGFMRQRGHHAIKMVGREHFTNPNLYDNNFIFTPPTATADWGSLR
jgi:hypothetical protein